MTKIDLQNLIKEEIENFIKLGVTNEGTTEKDFEHNGKTYKVKKIGDQINITSDNGSSVYRDVTNTLFDLDKVKTFGDLIKSTQMKESITETDIITEEQVKGLTKSFDTVINNYKDLLTKKSELVKNIKTILDNEKDTVKKEKAKEKHNNEIKAINKKIQDAEMKMKVAVDKLPTVELNDDTL